jgi:polysaccharide pyruvyl transferase WcaK-like protein
MCCFCVACQEKNRDLRRQLSETEMALEKAERRRDELTKGAMERAQLQYDNIKSL